MRFLIFFIFSLFNISSLQAQEKWNLEKCLRHALENNLQIKQSVINLEIAGNIHSQAFADFIPSLNGDLTYGMNFGRSIDPTTYSFVEQQIQTSGISMTSGVALFSGLRKINTLRQTKFDVLSNRFTTEEIANNVSLSITAAYLQILLSNEELKNVTERLKLSADQVEQSKKLLDAGMIPEGNLYDVLAQQANDSLAYIIAFNSVQLGKLNLALLLQIENPAAFDVETPGLTASAPVILNERNPENIFNAAVENQPSVKSAQYSIFSADKRWQATKGLYYPSLSFFYNLRTNYSSLGQRATNDIILQNPIIGYLDDGSNTFVRTFSNVPRFENSPYFDQYRENVYHTLGLRLDIPIFNGLQTRTSVKNAELQKLSAEYNYKSVEDQLKNDVYVAYADAKAAWQKYLAAQNSVKALEKSFEYMTKRFNLGAANSLEYSIANTNLAAAQIEILKSKYDYIFKLKVLDFYLGNPITLN